MVHRARKAGYNGRSTVSSVHSESLLMCGVGHRYLIGGNWKANGTQASVAALVDTLNSGGRIPLNVEVSAKDHIASL
jgi:hypothetical protein